MRYVVRKSIVRVVGRIWMPSVVCAQVRELSSYDVANIKSYGDAIGHPGINRESVEHWLHSNSGDFQSVTDFEASIEDGNDTIDIPWATEEGEFAYIDAMSEND
jgi:hypothetical protein